MGHPKRWFFFWHFGHGGDRIWVIGYDLTFISGFKVISMGQNGLFSVFSKKHQKYRFWDFKCLQLLKKLKGSKIFSNLLCFTPHYIIFMSKNAKKWDTPFWPYPFNEWKPPQNKALSSILLLSKKSNTKSIQEVQKKVVKCLSTVVTLGHLIKPSWRPNFMQWCNFPRNPIIHHL